jgi:hypothetical protein
MVKFNVSSIRKADGGLRLGAKPFLFGVLMSWSENNGLQVVDSRDNLLLTIVNPTIVYADSRCLQIGGFEEHKHSYGWRIYKEWEFQFVVED